MCLTNRDSCGRWSRTTILTFKASHPTVGRSRSEAPRGAGGSRPIVAAKCPAGIEPASPTWEVGTSASRSRAQALETAPATNDPCGIRTQPQRLERPATSPEVQRAEQQPRFEGALFPDQPGQMAPGTTTAPGRFATIRWRGANSAAHSGINAAWPGERPPPVRTARDGTRDVKKARCQAGTGLGRRAPQRPEASTRRNVGGAFGGLPCQAPNRNVNPFRSLPFAITLVLQPRHGNHSSPESMCRPTTRWPHTEQDAGTVRKVHRVLWELAKTTHRLFRRLSAMADWFTEMIHPVVPPRVRRAHTSDHLARPNNSP